MIHPTMTYELAKAIHDSRLKEAEQARFLRSLAVVTASPKPKTWLRYFFTVDIPTFRRIQSRGGIQSELPLSK